MLREQKKLPELLIHDDSWGSLKSRSCLVHVPLGKRDVLGVHPFCRKGSSVEKLEFASADIGRPGYFEGNSNVTQSRSASGTYLEYIPSAGRDQSWIVGKESVP